MKLDNSASAVNRQELKKSFAIDFLRDHNFNIHQLKSDASFRKYDRVICKGKTFILMDCPTEHYDLNDFIIVSNHLLKNNFSAPKVHHVDYNNGFLMIEDFGDLRIGDYLSCKSQHQTVEVYKLILDLLIELQKIPKIDSLKKYSKQLLLAELEIYVDWYVPYIRGIPWDEAQKRDFFVIWDELLALVAGADCITLRDYHVENMMLLRERSGISSIGLLDFQDAVIGSPMYDVVSVLEDARIDVPRSFAMQCLDYYLNNSMYLGANAELSYYILGAQRNSKILGIFARKIKRDNEQSYARYIPLVLKYLEYDLTHKCMIQLQTWLRQNL